MAEHEHAVQRFTAAAERYCDLIESDWRPRQETLLAELAEALAGLYAAALRLPDVQTESGDLPATRLSGDLWRTAFFLFADALRGRDFYRSVSPFDESVEGANVFGRLLNRAPKVLGGSLTDDLGDVYRDVKEGLLLRADGVAEDEVIWQWRFNFWAHWGEHAVDALRVIQLMLAEGFGPRYDLEQAPTRP